MGAVNFECEARGKTVSDAYSTAVEDARYWHGHGGYTGTIAEKHGFTEYIVPDGKAADVIALLVNASDADWDDKCKPALEALGAIVGHDTAKRMCATYNDKWGPAVAIKMSSNTWHFSGYASC